LTSRNTEKPSARRCLEYALNLLATRDYSSVRIRGKLVEKGFSEEDAEAVIDRLQEEGWINDPAFAARFAESAISSGRFYGARLKEEMRRRGIPAGIAEQALKQATDSSNQAELVRGILKRRYPCFSFDLSGEKEKRRIISYLRRRGYCFSTIMHVLVEPDSEGGDQ